MSIPFSEILSRLPDEERDEIMQRGAELIAEERRLYRIRQNLGITQAQMGSQAAISKLERRDDMLVSSLRNYIETLGGKLKIIATFVDHEIEVNL